MLGGYGGLLIFALVIPVVACWQVRLEKKVVVHYGIVCLIPDVITVMGGVVESLYEEWQMNQKYAGFSRSSLRLGREGDAGGPPPFEKLQIGGPKHGFARNGILLLILLLFFMITALSRVMFLFFMINYNL